MPKTVWKHIFCSIRWQAKPSCRALRNTLAKTANCGRGQAFCTISTTQRQNPVLNATGLDATEILAGRLPEDALQAIRAHNGEHNGTPVQRRLDIALRCGETVTGLVTAAALVRPTGITGMEVKSLKKKMKDKAFAAGVNRDVIKSCTDMGLSLEEFLGLAIASMAARAKELGLLKEAA